MKKIWMITFTVWDNTRHGNVRTSTIKTELHPIKWRDEFLKNGLHNGKEIDGCNILFAIEGEDE